MTKPIAAVVLLLMLAAYAHSETHKDPAATDAKPQATPKSDQLNSKGLAASAASGAKDGSSKPGDPADPEKIDWSKVDWKKRLTRLQYHITREAGTERAFTGKYWDFFKPGQYRCVGCGLPLFESDAKFESDCGWPSFDRPISDKTLTEHVDFKIGYPRTEIRCRRCQAHLGHVFNDGPTETGQRYCLNSAAMTFVSEKKLRAEQHAGATEQVPAKDASAAPAAR